MLRGGDYVYQGEVKDSDKLPIQCAHRRARGVVLPWMNRYDKEALLQALKEAYGKMRSLSSLSLAFHSTRQGGYEGVWQYSTRVHAAFVDLKKQHRRYNIALVDEACVKSQVIEGTRDEHLKLSPRQHSLASPNISFQELRKTVLSRKQETED